MVDLHLFREVVDLVFDCVALLEGMLVLIDIGLHSVVVKLHHHLAQLGYFIFCPVGE